MLLWFCVAGRRRAAVAASAPTAPIRPCRPTRNWPTSCFVDAEHGWAVGDRGVIWHTADGGAHWTLQNSGVDCRLAVGLFLDEKIGWAAGGSTQPYTHVDQRRDPAHPRRRPALDAPTASWSCRRFERLALLRSRRTAGPWAQPSAYFPSGVFATADGGRSWSALPAADTRAWLTGDFVDPDTGALAGRASALAVVRRRGDRSRWPPTSDCAALRRMKLVAPARAGWWATADWCSRRTTWASRWQTPEGEIPAADAQPLRFHGPGGARRSTAGSPARPARACCTAPTAGRPGRPRANRPTAADPRPRVRRRAQRLGRRATWARFWPPTRRRPHLADSSAAAARAAPILGFYGRGDRDSAWSWWPGCRPTTAIWARSRYSIARTSRPRTASSRRARGARSQRVLAGGSAAGAAWRFPLRAAGLKLSAEQLVEVWNQANDGGALEKLEAHVVARIRMWRPSVRVHRVGRCRAAAIRWRTSSISSCCAPSERAGDPAQFPEQIAEAGLQPWKVQKVYGTLPAGQSGNGQRQHGAAGGTAGPLDRRAGGAGPRRVGRRVRPRRSPISAFACWSITFRRAPASAISSAASRCRPAARPAARSRNRGENNLEAMRREAQLRRNLQAILAAGRRKRRTRRPLPGRHRPADPRHGARAGRRDAVSTGRSLLLATAAGSWPPNVSPRSPSATRSIRWPPRRWYGWCSTTPAARPPGATAPPSNCRDDRASAQAPAAERSIPSADRARRSDGVKPASADHRPPAQIERGRRIDDGGAADDRAGQGRRLCQAIGTD